MESLLETLDKFNESQFYSLPIDKTQKQTMANLISSRQGIPGGYSKKFFAPTSADNMSSYKLFTGERPSSLSALHIVGEESCRALIMLGVKNPQVKTALDIASDSVLSAFRKERKTKKFFPSSFFCCPKCTCGLWRHLSARSDESSESDLSKALTSLKEWRNGEGGWKMFPQYYTMFTLTEMDSKKAIDELRYAAKSCENELSLNKCITGKYSQRRVDVMKKVLEIV